MTNLSELYKQGDHPGILRAVIDYHFGKHLQHANVSLDETLPLTAAHLIDLLVFEHNIPVLLYEYPSTEIRKAIRSIIAQKLSEYDYRHSGWEREAKLLEGKNDLLDKENRNLKRENEKLRTERDRLKKTVDQQNRILLKLQERIDLVINSGQQNG